MILTKNQKMIAFAFAVVVVVGGIIAGIVLSQSKDPVKPATKPSGATTKPTTKPSGTEKEVYFADKGGTNETRYAFTNLADAEAYATSLGGTIATMPQLIDAKAKGLHQCSFGWGKDDIHGRIYTVTTKPTADSTCPWAEGGVTNFWPRVSIGGVWVYGVKKPKSESVNCTGSKVSCVLPFSDTKWSQYD